MVSFLVRYIKRFIVLVPGLLIVYISVREIFPTLNDSLPFGVAIFVTYVLGAYVLIPAIIRLIRFFFKLKHPPTYCVTPDGFASDPINIGIVASRGELIAAMQSAGWAVADEHSFINVVREITAVLSRRRYESAPMSHLYLFGRRQDIGFEIQTDGFRGQRHHVRFWVTNYSPGRSLFSQRSAHGRAITPNTKQALWLGAASRDIGFALIRHNAQLSHMIHPDTDSERELIINGLQQANCLDSVERVTINPPYRVVNRVWRGYLESDGELAICRLSEPAPTPSSN